MMMSSRYLGEAIERMGMYHSIIGTLITGEVRAGFRTAKVLFSMPRNAPKLSRHCFECVASSLITRARKLTGRQINPREVGFASEAPESVAEYARVFHAPVFFGQRNTYMIVDSRIGGIPVLQPNPQLLGFFEKYAKQYLARIEGDKKTVRAVVNFILTHLENRKIDINAVAREMSMSVRTLQNRLREEGAGFRDLLEDTRQRLAKGYLRENFSMEEISYILGYAATSVFSKAFKKWSGKSPSEYRDMLYSEERAYSVFDS